MNGPDFELEKPLHGSGYLVIGVDEVGRGALAGPVMAGACAIITNNQINTNKPITQLGRKEWLELGIDDSKRLSPEKRDKLARIIKNSALWGIGEAGVAYINKYGIVKATEKAMRGAVASCRKKLQLQKVFVLVDAFHVKYVPGVGLKNQKAVIKGDQKSISIAAASIIAKVHRDRLMRNFGKKLPFQKYHWDKNKGYGTANHLKALKKYGPSKLHRVAFVAHFL